MSQVTPSKVLAEVSAAVPTACRENIVTIGSLAAGYHFFGDDESKAVRTKDVDCVLEPFHAAVGAGQSIARQLLDAGWQRRMQGDHQNPGNDQTPVDQLPAVRLYPPEANPDSEEAWFIELLTVPESAEGTGKEWTRLPLAEGHFGLPTFRFLSIIAFDPLPAARARSCDFGGVTSSNVSSASARTSSTTRRWKPASSSAARRSPRRVAAKSSSSTDALTSWLESSRKVRESLQLLLTTSAK